MKRNIFAQVEYVGTNYFGFQIQNKQKQNELTVQAVIEQALEQLFKEKVRIQYSSRTDRGVHSKGQAINFVVSTPMPLRNMQRAINILLPKDIRVRGLKPVLLDFHARFWAKSKVYRYLIHRSRKYSVFLSDYTWWINTELSIPAMKKAAKSLIGTQDFYRFAKGAKRYKNCVRNIKSVTIKKQKSFIYIDIEADGFLRCMVRNIVAYLVRVGQGKIVVSTNKPAPAEGLYLEKVIYDI